MGKEVAQDSKVKVHYTGMLDDGSIFDTSKKREPLGFVVGEKNVIPGFESAVLGMKVGDKKTVKILADQAYGPVKEEMIITVGKDRIPSSLDPKVGQQLQINQENGHPIVVMIKEILEDKLILDANHPLAGKDLTFEIEVVEIS